MKPGHKDSANGRERVKVLIVDDLPANLDALESILRPTRYWIQRASSGEEALKLLLEEEYACCLLDIRMPGMSGFETAEIIRSDAQLQRLPIIFVTAELGDQRDVFRGYETGAVDFLIKPLEPFMVKSKVEVFGELYLQRRALERSKEIEELNGKLLRLNESLRDANRDLEHFTNIAAHDLREPLRKQRNMVDLLCSELPDEVLSERRGLVDRIAGQSARLLSMIDSLQSLTKLGHGELNREVVDLKELIEACLASFQDRLRQRDVSIAVDPMPSQVEAYKPLLAALYQRLIENVFDHVRGNGFEMRFTADLSRRPCVFGVLNTRSSIPQERLGEIFKAFRKADLGREQGIGMGLTLCKKAIDRHHGQIFAESGGDFVHMKFTLEEL